MPSVKGVPLSSKVTVPVGVPEPGAVAATVAVNVTEAPDVLGLALEVSAVVVLACFTAWEMALEILVVKFVSPK